MILSGSDSQCKRSLIKLGETSPARTSQYNLSSRAQNGLEWSHQHLWSIGKNGVAIVEAGVNECTHECMSCFE